MVQIVLETGKESAVCKLFKALTKWLLRSKRSYYLSTDKIWS